jgi:putative spermidine/putrescine transport system permease protein
MRSAAAAGHSSTADRVARQTTAGDLSYRIVLGLLSAAALLILITPVVVVIITSFTDSRSLRFPPPAFSLRWYSALFDPVQSAQIHMAAWNSLVIALSATAISVVLGTAAALAISGRRTWWTQTLDALFMSPLILPTLAFGLAALMFFSTLRLPLSIPLMILGHVAVVVPFILRTTIASMSQLDRGLLDTSASLGAGAAYTFRRVTLPAIRPGILAGAFIAFMASVDNVSVSLFLAGPENDVLPIRMWSMLESQLDVRTAAVSGVLIFTTAILVIVMDRIVGLTRRIS